MFNQIISKAAVANNSEAMETRDHLWRVCSSHFKNGESPKIHKSRINILLFFAAMFLSSCLLFVGCNDKDEEPTDDIPFCPFDGVVAAQVEDGNKYNPPIVRRVRAVYWWDGGDEDGTTLVYANYTNGGFTMTFPVPNAQHLTKVDDDDRFHWNDISNIRISNLDAKLLKVDYFEGFSSSSGAFNMSAWVIDFWWGKVDSQKTIYAVPVYSDSDVTIRGSYKKDGSFTETYSLSFKQGWNWMYKTDSEYELKFTTECINDLKWYSYDDF